MTSRNTFGQFKEGVQVATLFSSFRQFADNYTYAISDKNWKKKKTSKSDKLATHCNALETPDTLNNVPLQKEQKLATLVNSPRI